LINQITKSQAVTSLVPNLVFHLQPDGKIELANIDGQENTGTIPSEAEITTEMERLQAEYDAQDYARKRASEYPSIADQLDDIYHNGIDAWKATIKLTKDKYPKS
jgi:hypothetical protein